MRQVCLAPFVTLLLLAGPGGLEGQEAAANALTVQERAQGWQLLFDGRTLDGWRAYGGRQAPEAWGVKDGALALTPGEGGGDLLSRKEFRDFELSLEWKISPGGNSGIIFRVSEDWNHSWETGPEMQVLDNEGHPDGRLPETSAGSNFALHAPAQDATKSVGEWNHARLVVQGSHVEHWLNGVKLLEYELWSDDWDRRVAESKFDAMPAYGTNRSGHLVLQDHGDPVWYRNIKVRPLEGDASGRP